MNEWFRLKQYWSNKKEREMNKKKDKRIKVSKKVFFHDGTWWLDRSLTDLIDEFKDTREAWEDAGFGNVQITHDARTEAYADVDKFYIYAERPETDKEMDTRLAKEKVNRKKKKEVKKKDKEVMLAGITKTINKLPEKDRKELFDKFFRIE